MTIYSDKWRFTLEAEFECECSKEQAERDMRNGLADLKFLESEAIGDEKPRVLTQQG